jgi:KipI family sensor histidine kinase inhibitor
MTGDSPRLLSCGDAAISVDFGNVISIDVNRRVHALDMAFRAARLHGIIETVPTYRALTIHFDPLVLPIEQLERELPGLLEGLNGQPATSRRWRVPVVFGGAFGMDFDEVANELDLNFETFVARFVAPVYHVMMIGFMPGFSYLANLPDDLARARRAAPRRLVPSGSISIGGAQAAIGSVESPSGWHMLGRTPALPFMPGRDPLCLFEAGDEIQFEPVPPSEWNALEAAAAKGDTLVRQDTTRP